MYPFQTKRRYHTRSSGHTVKVTPALTSWCSLPFQPSLRELSGQVTRRTWNRCWDMPGYGTWMCYRGRSIVAQRESLLQISQKQATLWGVYGSGGCLKSNWGAPTGSPSGIWMLPATMWPRRAATPQTSFWKRPQQQQAPECSFGGLWSRKPNHVRTGSWLVEIIQVCCFASEPGCADT